MIKRNKLTGQTVEIPDDTPPEMMAQAIQQALAKSAQKPDAPRIPALDFLGGAGNTIDKTFINPLNRIFGSKLPKIGDPDASESMAGKVGEIGMDAGLMAATPAGKFKILGPALSGTAQHQVQTYGETGKVDPTMAATEMAVSTAVPGVGSKIPGFLKSLGVNSLRRGLGVSKTMMKGSNPPQLEAALQARKIPFTGGAERIAKERGDALSMADDARGELLDKAGVDLNLNAANSDARLSIARQVGEGSKGLTPRDEGLASNFLDDYAEQALRTPGYNNGMVSGRQAIQIRKGADKNARFIAGETPEGRNLASQEYRNAIEDRAMKAVDARNLPNLSRDYRAIKEEMALDAPLLEAARDKAAAQPGKMGLYTDLTLGGLGLGAGIMNPLAALGPASVIAARHALTSPGGGRAFYELGRAADNTAVRRGGRSGLNLARTAFSPEGE